MDRRARWHLAQDVGLAVVVAALGLAEMWVPFESTQGAAPSAATSVAVVVAAIALAFRRTRPIVLVVVPAVWVAAAFAGGGVVPILFFGQLVPMYLALYSAVRHGTRRDGPVVVGAVLAAVVAADLTQPVLQSPSELLFHWGVLLAVLGIGWGLRSSERRAVDAAVRAAEAQAAAREASARAVADERARISRELHDILGHSVSVMVVQAGAAAQAVEDDPAFVRGALDTIRSTGSDALAEVRRVVALLREDDDRTLAPQPGIDRIAELVEHARMDGLEVEYRTAGGVAHLGAGEQLAIFRIVQESLTNVRKHALASNATVTLTSADGRVDIAIEDDGPRRPAAAPGASGTPAPTLARPGGHGLIGMRERVALYGGEFAAGPTEGGQGWTVHASLPTRGAS